MKLSLFTEVQCPTGASPVQRLEELLEQAELADALGFHGLWISEIHFQLGFSLFSAPYPVLGAVAQRTRRLHLGVAVNILPIHHPLHLAEQAAMLDLLSNGRMEFAVGRGHVHTRIYEAFEVNHENSRAMLEEGLKVILGAWTRDVLEFQGNFYHIPEVVVDPKPLRKPPPVYVAVSSPDSVELAARLGLNLFASLIVFPERVRTFSALYWDKLSSYGQDASQRELGVLVPMHLAETQEAAREQAQEGIMDYYRVIVEAGDDYRGWLARRGVDTSDMPPSPGAGMTFERVCRQHAVVTDPATAVLELKRLAEETGATHLLCWMNIGSVPHDRVVRSMKLFAQEVMPALATTAPGHRR